MRNIRLRAFGIALINVLIVWVIGGTVLFGIIKSGNIREYEIEGFIWMMGILLFWAGLIPGLISGMTHYEHLKNTAPIEAVERRKTLLLNVVEEHPQEFRDFINACKQSPPAE